MTRLYDGIGVTVTLATIFLITTPLITVLLISELGVFNGVNEILRKVMAGLTFLLLMVLALFITRAFPYRSLDGFLVYNFILIITWIICRIKNIKRAASDNG